MKLKELPYTTIQEMEEYVIKKALKRYPTKKAAARMMGITPRTLQNKLKELNLA